MQLMLIFSQFLLWGPHNSEPVAVDCMRFYGWGTSPDGGSTLLGALNYIQ